MNGKQAKMLRKLGRDDNKSKALFYAMDAKTKGELRKSVGEMVEYNKAMQVVSANLANIEEQPVEDGASV